MNKMEEYMETNEQVTRVAVLRDRHQALDDEADELNSRQWLSAREQLKLKELKVRRLRLRDLIDELTSENEEG
jgi:hypothetical protein